jgi:lysophospholipase L1-like esterase
MAKRGDNTRDLLRRFDEDVAAKKPDVLSVCIGANDAVCAGYMVFLNIITVTGI